MIRVLAGIALLFGTAIYAVLFATRIIQAPDQLIGPMLVGVALGILWLLYVIIDGLARRE